MNYWIRWVLAWSCYWIGHGISRFPWYPYFLYNRFMMWSLDLDHDDLGIWEPVNKGETPQ